MKTILLSLLFSFPFIICPAQSKVKVDIASPKPSIMIDGLNCVIGNTIYSCTPKTCTAVQITEGDSIEFCTHNEIYLNTDSAYWMQWNFTGSSYSASFTDSFPTNTPICYFPKWNVAGIYTVDIFYNGWLSAYPTSDCWVQGPSHWIILVDVLVNTGIGSQNENASTCEIFPNPGNGIFELRFSKPETVKEIYVTDITGKEIFTLQNKTQINLSGYPAGIYFLNIISENGKMVKKIVNT
ncbi:MAG: T9SS type A sorting domain-containing protein [Bacteroidota bacterium]|nr:T9SS type A sorting domain-containing protein [Bacteroidota bacterium]